MPTFRIQLAMAVAAVFVVLSVPRTASAEPQGVWEPVNYSEDLTFTDVFFVTPEVGYVSGAAGTILKTTDGGASWTTQLGGDPASGQPAIDRLVFVTENVGWAVQVSSTEATLLQITDGEYWKPIGMLEEHYEDLAFTSEQDGVYTTGAEIHRTDDGGRNWSRVSDCKARGEVDGLVRQVDCHITRMHFPAPPVGYAVADGEGAAWILRTDDGGTSWRAVTPLIGEYGRSSGIFFIDENTGYVRVHSGRSYRTEDGGQTWTAIPGVSLGTRIRFADPQVGWSFADLCIGMGCENANLAYTTDGGRRWASRSIPLPAGVQAFSMPRRDTAFAVGEHGMIYRYRTLPDGTPAAPKAIVSVAMPLLDAEVFEQVAQIEGELEELGAMIEEAEAAGANGAEPASADGGLAPADADAAPWDDSTWEQFEPLESGVEMLAAELPEFGSKHRNLNLVLAGLKLLGDLTSEGEGLKQAFTSLREAQDLESMSAALHGLYTELDTVKMSIEAFRPDQGEFQ